MIFFRIARYTLVTLSHAIEPQFVGAFEQVVNLTEAFDSQSLIKNRNYIIETILHNKTFHQQCSRYLSGACSVLEDNYRIAFDATDFNKIKRTATLMANKILPKKHKFSPPVENCRILSAVTNKGYVLLPVPNFKVYLIEDPYGAVTTAFLAELRAVCLGHGYNVCSCFSPFAPFERIEHLIIPEVGIIFMSKNLLHTPANEPNKVISYKRFTNLEPIRAYKKRILFNKKAITAMVEHAVRAISDGKTSHDAIEEAYRPYIDFSIIDTISVDLMQRIFGE